MLGAISAPTDSPPMTANVATSSDNGDSGRCVPSPQIFPQENSCLAVAQLESGTECAFIGQSVSICPHPPLSPPLSTSVLSLFPTASPSLSPTASPSLSPASSAFVSLASSPEISARAIPALWDAAHTALAPSEQPATSISALLPRHRQASSGGALMHTVTAPPRAIMATPPPTDLPPPYSTTELPTVPLPPVPAHHHVVAHPAAGRLHAPRGYSPNMIPINSGTGAIARVVNTLCTPEVRRYLHALQPDPVVYEVVHKCMLSYPNHGARNWAARFSECGFTRAEATALVNLFPRRPRGTTV